MYISKIEITAINKEYAILMMEVVNVMLDSQGAIVLKNLLEVVLLNVMEKESVNQIVRVNVILDSPEKLVLHVLIEALQHVKIT